MEFASHPCDDPRVFGLYGDAVTRSVCEKHGVSKGSEVPLFFLEGQDTYADEETLRAFLGAVFATEPVLVFSAAIPDGVGMSFATAPRKQPGLGEVAGVWFSVKPGDDGAIASIFFHSPQSGPRALFQHFYQPRGGQVWFYDSGRAPGAVVPMPDTPAPKP